MKIGLISDTHGHVDDKILFHFKDCEEIWHVGDVGTLSVIEELETICPVRAVFGNIDGQDIRIRYPEHQKFTMNGVRVWLTHIGGYPGRYNPQIREQIYRLKPDLFICGHSHILKVMRDKKTPNLLHMNPGAAGIHGIHKIRTLLRFELVQGKVINLQAIELGPRTT